MKWAGIRALTVFSGIRQRKNLVPIPQICSYKIKKHYQLSDIGLKFSETQLFSLRVPFCVFSTGFYCVYFTKDGKAQKVNLLLHGHSNQWQKWKLH